MPEGPEIHRAADKVRKALHGKEIEDIEITLPQYVSWEKKLLGKKVNKVEARGKALLIYFDDIVVYSHNQLYGRWTVNLKKTAPRKWNRSLRISYSTDKHTCRLWSATDILFLEEWELSGHPYLAKLGPDIVNPETTIDEMMNHLNKDKFKRRRLKTLLLDQGFFSGVGNYLRSEILFTASLHPDRTVGSLTEEEKNALVQQTLFLARQSYEIPGITVDLELYQKLRDKGESRSWSRHWVFTRNERPCHQCGDLILHTRPGGRRLDYCPSCQH